MARDRLRTLAEVLEVVRPAFTRPSFERFVALVRGWLLAERAGPVTSALVGAGIAGRQHHEAFHRFFSRGTWSVDEVGTQLLRWIASHAASDGSLQLAIDDTVAKKKGPKLFGLGTHLDPVRSTRRVRNFVFGHLWVVLVAIIKVPFSNRRWAVPIFFRLYRQERDCARTNDPYRKRTELARELIELASCVVPALKLHVSADAAYCCETVLRNLPSNVIVYGTLRDNAVLTSAPPAAVRRRAGRPRVRGERLPTPAQLAASSSRWRTVHASLYGVGRKLSIKQMDAQWYQGRGPEVLRVVVVRLTTGKLPHRVYFCTDPSRSPTEIVERYTARWQIEVCFRDLKQHLGFGAGPARSRNAVERVTPFAAYVYSLTVLWARTALRRVDRAPRIKRPWYRDKVGLSFADLLHVARRDVLDLGMRSGRAKNSTRLGNLAVARAA